MVGHYACVRASLGISVVVAALAMSSCGSGSSTAAGNPSTSSSSSTLYSSNGSDGLQRAAVAWAKAYLTGTALDQLGVQGPECVSGGPPKLTPANIRAAESALRQHRAQLQQHLGVAPSAVKIAGVNVRNVTATSGEAEVQYNLPPSVVGNDNWVTYELHGGYWKVADCHAPIGGNSSSVSVTITTAAP